MYLLLWALCFKLVCVFYVFFFFKQKTAYEMRISDWSSDVCSSDLAVMSVISAILIGLAMGLVFGFALEKSRVFEPGIILGQMQLRNFTMLKVFLSAEIGRAHV